MSYNLLLDTNFKSLNKHWKFTNCKYENGFIVSDNSTTYAIEQEVILPDPTKLYFSFECLSFDKNIKSVYCGILSSQSKLEAVKKKVPVRKRRRLSVVDTVATEKIKVMVVIEAKTTDTRIHIDSPLLVDLVYQQKSGWPKYILNQLLDYRYGYDYENEYQLNEIELGHEDFSSPYTKTEKGKIGILATVIENDWFKINHTFKQDRIYLVKLDYEEINTYGDIYLTYGETTSVRVKNDEQQYMLFKGDDKNQLRLQMINKESLPYYINLKHIMIIDITNLKIDEDDIPHLPFI